MPLADWSVDNIIWGVTDKPRIEMNQALISWEEKNLIPNYYLQEIFT